MPAMTTSTTSQPTLSFPRDIFAKLSPHPYLLAHLQPTSTTTGPSRANGRTPSTFRPIHINTSSLTHASGSSVVRIGDTTCVCGVRGEILHAKDASGYRVDRASTTLPANYNEAKELDLLVPNIELATGCSPAYLPGQPPGPLAQSLSTRLYSLLHSSGLISDEDLRIWYQPPDLSALASEDAMEDVEGAEAPEPEIKAFWTLYIDILFISLDGNPFDAAWAAVLAALKDVRLPRAYWDADRESVICDDSVEGSKRLNLAGLPVAVTALVFKAKEVKGDKGHWVLVDPDTFEEGLCDEAVTVVVDCGVGETKVLSISKAGGTIVGQEQMRNIVGLAEGRWQEVSQAVHR